ncbi:Lipoprotein releasing system, transmembrane protein, LolC/E family [Candidatus Koribacter versatilis Ellin345]|uniref:Lipoprotein releasing system, transmembrane protein, LolC/E family n=1 Tax=Koribacter versatilis (strain Ellin345) TaxID=204669 RepID=Q1IKN2_KORVE|nr:FtsX-like permease family protein [Candidatus Koribacter versatilis]ABF42568.1 Lipoprotein releasing system, transmembrane protein, LolC/E family [Candidatus Koribacter versatilis Ellin345]
MKFELFIATRYLRAKRRQAVIGVITGISIIGVAAGVASLIIALAINNGFRSDLQARLLGSMSHINLMRLQNDGIKNWRDLLAKLEKQPHVVAGAPAIYEQVLISRGARAQGALLKGIVPADERRVSALLDNVKFGSADALDSSQNGEGAPKTLSDEVTQSLPPIVLGKDMADTLGATTGSVVLVTSPQGELTPFGIVPKYQRFKVVGIFESGFYDYDSSWGLTRLDDAQKLFGLGDIVPVLEFKVDDIYKAPQIADQLVDVAGQGFGAKNWMEQNQALFRALRLEKVVTFITIGLIVFVAALNILISLIMMVMEKTKDIAVLVSIGARRLQIRRIFMLQGVLVGAVGTLIGLVLGFGLAIAAGHYHWIRLSAEVYAIDYVPFAPRLIDGLVVSVVSIAISFIATIYPAMNASRVLPAEALRYE